MPGNAQENDDIGSDLRAALQEASEQGNSNGQENQEESGREVVTFDAETGREVAPANDTGAQGQNRDASGRFAPRTPAKQVSENTEEAPLAAQQPQKGQRQAPAQAKGQQAAPATQQGSNSRAPMSWKPATRELWAKLPPEVQAEVTRREREVDTALRTSADSRKFLEGFQQMVAPYEHHFRAEGVNAMQAVDHMLQLGNQMRSGSPSTKANIIATLCRQHGVDINLLDQSLTAMLRGGPAPEDNPIMQHIDQRLKPLMDFMQNIQGMQQQAQTRSSQQAEQTLDEFMADPKNEFIHDVAGEMADLLDLAASRGQKLSLQDAYNRATLLHPEIADILAQRKLVERATQQTDAATRAQQASVSPASSGAPSQGGGNEEGDDIRSAIMASVNSLSRR